MEFCQQFAKHVLDPDFINLQLIGQYLGNNTAFTECIAYLYERARKTLVNQPATNGLTITDAAGVVRPLNEIGQLSAAQHWQHIAQSHRELASQNRVNDFLQSALPIKWSNEQSLQGPSFAKLGQTFNEVWYGNSDWGTVAQRRTDETTPTWASGGRDTYRNGSQYGVAILQWIKDRAQNGYGDIFNIPGSPYKDSAGSQRPGTGLGCFARGTRIRTDTGDKAIECIDKHTRVLTRAPGEYGTNSVIS